MGVFDFCFYVFIYVVFVLSNFFVLGRGVVRGLGGGRRECEILGLGLGVVGVGRG